VGLASIALTALFGRESNAHIRALDPSAVFWSS